MKDLQSPRWIVLKGILFLLMIFLAGAGILLELPSWRIALLLGVLIWASARFYYFLFYVLEHYVDSSLRYAGLLALLQHLWSSRGRPRS